MIVRYVRWTNELRQRRCRRGKHPRRYRHTNDAGYTFCGACLSEVPR